MNSKKSPYHGYRYPAEIISHAVWLYYRFCLSRGSPVSFVDGSIPKKSSKLFQQLSNTGDLEVLRERLQLPCCFWSLFRDVLDHLSNGVLAARSGANSWKFLVNTNELCRKWYLFYTFRTQDGESWIGVKFNLHCAWSRW